MKCYLMADAENPQAFRMARSKEEAQEFLAGHKKFTWTRLYEPDIRAMGCTKKLPTGKQVIAVNLEMR